MSTRPDGLLPSRESITAAMTGPLPIVSIVPTATPECSIALKKQTWKSAMAAPAATASVRRRGRLRPSVASP